MGQFSMEIRTLSGSVLGGNQQYVISKLKTRPSVHVLFENGSAARFTLKGSSQAIKACISDFAR